MKELAYQNSKNINRLKIITLDWSIKVSKSNENERM